MKIRIVAAALVAMFLAIGISNQASAHPWHRGGWCGPRFGVSVVVPAPVVVGGGYYDAYPPAPAPVYYRPAPVVVAGGYYGGGYGYYGHRERWDRDCREGYRENYRGGYYGPRGGYGRGYYRR